MTRRRRRSGKPRVGRWRAHVEAQARAASTARLRHVVRDEGTDALRREVYAAELAERDQENTDR